MDGMRARRLKVGSPLGRMIDEAGDCIVMSCYSTLIGYAFVFDNTLLDLICFYMNLGFYGMEIHFVVTGKLDMAIGEISSVEIECALALIMVICGIYGTDGL